MKRITVRRMLKQRLAESKRSIELSHQNEDLVNVLGGDNSKENQFRLNMEKDIEDLEFIICCLNQRQINNTMSEIVGRFSNGA